jgi:DNA primase
VAQDNVERIKERVDIVDLIGSRMQLRRAGRSFKGLCPFHQEKTPSFHVYPDTQGYHCFGCGKNGDIFSFVMDTENLTFTDALERLAQRAGIELKANRPNNPERDERRQRLIELHERAAAYYSSVLWTSSLAEQARALVERRGLDRKTAEAFGIGFAPDSWDALKSHLQQSANASEDQLVEAGLCSRADSGRVYDRFRNRLMFPIRDRRARAIGFGARALGDELPKYLNSPQTPLFNKSAALYAIDHAFDEIRRSRAMIVVEGYMDAITAHQFGFKNAVASMGTALTESQVFSIKNYVDKVYVALDSDSAGQLATIRAIDTLREGFSTDDDVTVDARGTVRTQSALEAEIRIVRLEQGKDPDELIRTNPDLWRQALEDAVPLVEYILTTRLSAIEDSPAARADALRDIAAPVLREIRDEIVRAEYIDLTARLLGYKDSIVRAALRPGRAVRMGEQAGRQRLVPAIPENILVALLLQYPLGYAARAGTLDTIDAQMFRDVRNRQIFEALAQADHNAATALSDLPDELGAFSEALRALVQVRHDLTPGMANNEILQALETINRARYHEMVRQAQDDIESAKEQGDGELMRAGLERMAELARAKPGYAPRESPYFNDVRTRAS